MNMEYFLNSHCHWRYLLKFGMLQVCLKNKINSLLTENYFILAIYVTLRKASIP